MRSQSVEPGSQPDSPLGARSSETAARRGGVDDRPGARWVLAGGVLMQCLLFVRVAVIYAPGLYLGPSGSDRVFYFAYVRSLVIDGDLSFADEFAMRPPSSGLEIVDGKPLNRYPIGAPLLALPAYLLTDALMGGTRAARTGYERPYVYAYTLSQLAFAALGMVLLYAALCRFAAPFPAAIGVVGASLGTGLTLYLVADLMMSHAAASFGVAWCLLESVRLRERPMSRARWARLGMASAFVVMARLQNLVFMLVPAVAAISALQETMLDRHLLRRQATCLLAVAAGFVLAFSPQLLAWRVMFGKWIVNSYSSDMSFHWLAPQWLELAKLMRWLPVIALGLCVTLVLAWRRRDPLLGAVVLSFLASIYAVLCWGWPGIVARTAFDNLAPIAIGLAVVAESLGRRRPGLEWLALALPIGWNVPFVVGSAPSGFESLTALARQWWSGVEVLLKLRL